MKDTTSIKAFRIETAKDTTSIWVDKSIVEHYTNEKSIDTVQVLAIVLPVAAALLTLFLTRLFDNLAENKKYKRELKSESRNQRIIILKYLNELRTSLFKTNFPDADLDDFYRWTADRMISVNPFHDLKVNSNILFNKDIIEISDNLYNCAEKINLDFDWNNREQPDSNIDLGKEILENLDLIIDKISQNIKNE